MNSKQFCSVCKQWLDMAVVPTGDDDEDDGVVWFRCPRCQGFLPKLSSQLAEQEQEAEPEQESEQEGERAPAAPEPDAGEGGDDDLPWDSPADMMAAREADLAAAPAPVVPDLDAPDVADAVAGADEAPEPEPGADTEADTAGTSEPLAEYAAMLADADPASARPYRPWETYEVGECVHHLAWDDCGVVVAKEDLPGGRHVVKCYFESAGVVRLIEKAPR